MALKLNLVIDQGSTFTNTIFLTDVNGDPRDLSGYTSSAQLRKHYTSSNAVSFTTSINTISGSLTLTMTANQTSSIVDGRYVYDVEIKNNDYIERVREGIVTVTPEVTK